MSVVIYRAGSIGMRHPGRADVIFSSTGLSETGEQFQKI
jgi:hypothetical protein